MGGTLDVIEALRTRRTAATFTDRAPSRDAIERIIRAATWAPNHRLTQPWRFVVIAGEERGRFVEAVTPGMDAKQAESTRTKLHRSPAIVVVVQQGTASEDETVYLEDYAACACATENLLLAAHAEGLAGKWSTGDLATSEAARAYLGLSGRDRIVAYVYLGYAASEPPPRSRAEPVIDWRG